MPDTAFLSLSEVATYLGISRPTVWRLLDSGELPGLKIRDTWRVEKADLSVWIDQQKSASQEKIRATKKPSKKRPVGRPRKVSFKPAAAGTR